MGKAICRNCNNFDKCVRNYTPYCDGYDPKEKTNEEYIRHANRVEMAKEIANHIFVSCTTNKAYSNPLYAMVLHDVVEWLKQPHNESSSNP